VGKAATATKDVTVWWCERCHASGLERLLGRLSVYDAVFAIEHAHNSHALARMQACRFDVGTVRVQDAGFLEAATPNGQTHKESQS
jgi:hypothetical protein